MPKKTKRILLSRAWSLILSLSLLLISRDLSLMMILLFPWIILANFVLHVNTASEIAPHEAHFQGLFCSAQHSCLRPRLLPGALGSRVPILPKHRRSCYRAHSCLCFQSIPSSSRCLLPNRRLTSPLLIPSGCPRQLPDSSTP